MKDLQLKINDNITGLAQISEILGANKINIEGLSMVSCEDFCIVHILVEDEKIASSALVENQFEISKISDVLIINKDERRITGRPGSFGDICRVLSNHEIKIEFGYPAENNRFVFGVNDVPMARELLNNSK